MLEMKVTLRLSHIVHFVNHNRRKWTENIYMQKSDFVASFTSDELYGDTECLSNEAYML